MNYGEIKDRVIEFLDWRGPDVEAKVKKWIQDTRIDIATRFDFPYLFASAFTLVTSSDSTFDVPDDYLDHMMLFVETEEGKIQVIYEVSPGYWARQLSIDPSLLQQFTDFYTVIWKGTFFTVIPSPPINRNLMMWYYRRPDELQNDGDFDYMTSTYGEVIVFGAAYRGALYLDDEAKITKFLAGYQDGIQKMIARESRKKADRRNFVRFKTWKDFSPEVLRKIFSVY